MRFPSKEIVEMVRKQYPIGTRVELTKMDASKHHRLEQKVQLLVLMIRQALWLPGITDVV